MSTRAPSSDPPPEELRPPTALVLIPGSINYFYNLTGRRLAETLAELGFAVEVATLQEARGDSYDWCAISNISEVLVAYGAREEGLERLRALIGTCKAVASCSLDSVETHWYTNLCEL